MTIDRPGWLRDWRGPVALLARALSIAMPVGLIVFLAFFALNYASLSADRGALAAQVRAGFADQQLEVEDAALFENIDIGVHQFNDCLILYQAIDGRGPVLQRAVSPISPPLELGFPCLRLRTLTRTGVAAAPRFYHHYLHGHTMLARLLVPELGVRGTRELYKLLISLLLLTGIAYAAVELTRGRRSDANAVWLVMFVVFARWFGFEGFGQSLGHAPADFILVGFLLYLSRASAAGPLSVRAAWASAAVFGALTMEFEFLTGGLPLGLAVVLGALPLTLKPDADVGRSVAGAAVAYVGAAATCIVAKAILLLAIFGSAPLVEIWAQFLVRTGVGAAPNYDGAADLGSFVWNMWAAMDVLTMGMHWLAVGSVVLAVVAGGWGYHRLRIGEHAADRIWATALLGSNLAILFWLVLFWQHAATHAWFMARLLVWPVASGAAMFVLALRRRPPRDPVAT